MVYIRDMRLLRIVAATGVLALTASAQQTPQVVGGVSSTAAVEIDGTPMAAAPSWPLVDRDLVRTTSAPGLILTTDQNAITLMRETAVRVRAIQPNQTWIFVHEGGLSVKTKNNRVLICIANRLFQPSESASGTLNLEKSGAVTRTVANGLLTELPVKACGDELAAGMVPLPAGAVAGGTAGTATATASAAGAATAAGVATTVASAVVSVGLATAVGIVSSAGSNSCASSSGCNFNPPPVTPSSP
jgi:hypothetical protein